jgi:glycosyltransferase involved in cell wall biosynthesis
VRQHGNTSTVDVDFSLAIHNRTGKYFIGRDVIALFGDMVGSVYYGSLPLRKPPTGLTARLLGRAQRWQVMSRVGPHRISWPQRPRGVRPLLHLDPFTVPTTRLRRSDAVLCHDIGPLTHPSLFDPGVCAAYRRIYANIARAGPHVVFVSRTSEDAFHTFFPNSRLSSSRVIYPMLRTEISSEQASTVADIDGPFLLTVGSIGSRKNQARCIAAFGRSGLADRGVRYVVCGGKEPGSDHVEALAKRTMGVTLLPYVSDAELAWLYCNAQGFVLASLLEGFGIPVAEAIAHGLVPVVSRDGVLAEVAGPGAVQVDPLDEADIAEAMVTLTDLDDARRSVHMRTLQESVRRFTVDQFEQGWNDLINEMAVA